MSVLKQVDFEVSGFGEFAAPPRKPSGYPEAVLGMSPVSYWRMGELSGTTLADEVGGNPLTLSGTTTLGEAGALAIQNDGAVRFNSGLATSASAVLPTTAAAAFTLVFWARLPASVAAGVFIQQLDSASNGRLRIFLKSNGKLRYAVRGDGLLDTTETLSSSWRMVVLTRAVTGTLSWYVDGQLDTQAAGHDEAIHDAPFRLGLIGAGAPDVALDEVAVFGQSLSAAQVQWLYELGTGYLLETLSP